MFNPICLSLTCTLELAFHGLLQELQFQHSTQYQFRVCPISTLSPPPSKVTSEHASLSCKQTPPVHIHTLIYTFLTNEFNNSKNPLRKTSPCFTSTSPNFPAHYKLPAHPLPTKPFFPFFRHPHTARSSLSCGVRCFKVKIPI